MSQQKIYRSKENKTTSKRKDYHPNLYILLKTYKNIISLTKFMSKVFKIIIKKETIEIIKDNKRIISTSKIKMNNVFVIILDSMKIYVKSQTFCFEF